jgi:hypothetical protein
MGVRVTRRKMRTRMYLVCCSMKGAAPGPLSSQLRVNGNALALLSGSAAARFL